MKIAHIHWSYLPKIGGIETHINNITQNDKINQKIFCGTKTSKFKSTYIKGLDIKLKTIKGLGTIKGFDIVNIHNGHLIKSETTISNISLLKQNNKKIILSVHNINNKEKSIELLKDKVDCIIVFSKYMQEVLFKKGINSTILPLSFTIPKINKKITKKNKTIKILQPTRFSKWKGSYKSIEAMNKLLGENKKFIFTHAGSKNLLFDKVNINWEEFDSNIKKKIKLKQFTEEELINEMVSSDIIIHPTQGKGDEGEPFGISCAQAIMLNKNIIATKSGNLPIMLKEYKNKILVNIGNFEEINKAILALIEKPLNENNITYIRKMINYHKQSSNEHLKLYKNILSK